MRFGHEELFNDEFQCWPLEVHYDFASKTGTLTVCLFQCADAKGTIAFFTRMDPDVKTIRVIDDAGPVNDYILGEDGEWFSRNNDRLRPSSEEIDKMLENA